MMNIYDSTIAHESRGFTGTNNWYKHLLGFLYTDGVQWLAEKLSCYWLIDEIIFNTKSFWNEEPFFVIDFTTPVRGKGILHITDGNARTLKKVRYNYTDLFINGNSFGSTQKEMSKESKIQFFFVRDNNTYVLMLPSEY